MFNFGSAIRTPRCLGEHQGLLWYPHLTPLGFVAQSWYAQGMRATEACSHTIFRAGGVQQLFGADSCTIKEHNALAGTGVTLYKLLSWWVAAHPALLLQML